MPIRTFIYARQVNAGEEDSPTQEIDIFANKNVVAVSINAIISDFQLKVNSLDDFIIFLTKFGSDPYINIYERSSKRLAPQDCYVYKTDRINWVIENIGDKAGYYSISFDVEV